MLVFILNFVTSHEVLAMFNDRKLYISAATLQFSFL